MKLLEEELQKEIDGQQTPPEIPAGSVELFNRIIEKKFNDMELRLNSRIDNLKKTNEKTVVEEKIETVEERSEKNDSSTEQSIT